MLMFIVIIIMMMIRIIIPELIDSLQVSIFHILQEKMKIVLYLKLYMLNKELAFSQKNLALRTNPNC